MTAKLIVLGSANLDYTVKVERHPEPGETLLGHHLVRSPGGKGANQALAAARFGARPLFVGTVGNDSDGRRILEALSAGGVDVSRVGVVDDEPTGVALVTVSSDGENTIVVAPGANARTRELDIARAISELAGPGTVLLGQLEVPLETVTRAALLVEQLGGRVILNLSPSRPVPNTLLTVCDPLVINETEAQAVTGTVIRSIDDAKRASSSLIKRCRSVVITLGADGAVFATRDGGGHVPARPAEVVDTTGAGDAFVGALSAALASPSHIDGLQGAVEHGVAAGADAVQWVGAQPPLKK